MFFARFQLTLIKVGCKWDYSLPGRKNENIFMSFSRHRQTTWTYWRRAAPWDGTKWKFPLGLPPQTFPSVVSSPFLARATTVKFHVSHDPMGQTINLSPIHWPSTLYLGRRLLTHWRRLSHQGKVCVELVLNDPRTRRKNEDWWRDCGIRRWHEKTWEKKSKRKSKVENTNFVRKKWEFLYSWEKS